MLCFRNAALLTGLFFFFSPRDITLKTLEMWLGKAQMETRLHSFIGHLGPNVSHVFFFSPLPLTPLSFKKKKKKSVIRWLPIAVTAKYGTSDSEVIASAGGG